MGINPDTLIKINLGEYNNLLARCYTEISAESRTMHKSHGFGASGRRENFYNYFFQLEDQTAKNCLFDGIDLSWDKLMEVKKFQNFYLRLRENLILKIHLK